MPLERLSLEPGLLECVQEIEIGSRVSLRRVTLLKGETVGLAVRWRYAPACAW
jgi:hypothetical protein